MTEIAVPLTVPDPATTRWVPVFGGSSGGGAALPADTVVAAATRIIANLTTAGDAQPAWRVLGSGRMDWGPGGATAPDTNLYRQAAGKLQTDGTLIAGVLKLGTATGTENFYKSGTGYIQTDGGMILSSDLTVNYAINDSVEISNAMGAGKPGFRFYYTHDTNLYRLAAGALKTDGEFHVGTYMYLDGGTSAVIARNMSGVGQATLAQRLAADTQDRFELFADGKMYWGPGNAAVDTNLYRSAAGVLKTDNSFITAGNLSVLLATGDTQPQIVLSRNFAGSGLPGIQFGVGGSTAGDTNLYRSAAGLLQTDTSLRVNQQLQVGVGANLAISANAITITASYHALTGTGPLKTINGVVSGSGVSLLVLRNGTGAALVIDSTGNIYATGGAGSIVLPNNETVALYYDANSSVWRVLHVSTAPAIQLIQTITLASDGPISFQNIPQIFTHLEMRGSVRSSSTGSTVDQINIRFNNDSGANYQAEFVAGLGASSIGNFNTSIAALTTVAANLGDIMANGSGSAAQLFSPWQVFIPRYTNTNIWKAAIWTTWQDISRCVELLGGRWASTAAINRIDCLSTNGASNNLMAGSSVSLYGITG